MGGRSRVLLPVVLAVLLAISLLPMPLWAAPPMAVAGAGGAGGGAAPAFPVRSARTAAPQASSAQTRYRLEATVDVRRRLLEGRLQVDLRNAARVALSELVFLLYPNHFARRSPGLNDYNFHWVYPGGFSAGGIEIDELRVDGTPLPAAAAHLEETRGGPTTTLRLRLPAALASGARTRVAIRFRTRLPERYGSFGCVGRRCILGGGYHPTLAWLRPDGSFDVEAPPPPADFELELRAPAGALVAAGGMLLDAGAGKQVDRRPRGQAHGQVGGQAGWPVSASLESVPYLPLALVVGGRLSRLKSASGVEVVYLHLSDRPPPSDDQVLPYLLEDLPGRVLRTADNALSLAAASGLRLPPRLLLVESASRTYLAEPHPGQVLVADQAFRIFPIERARKFHELQIARAVFGELAAAGRLAAVEDPRLLSLSADVVASFLVDLYTQHLYRRPEFAGDLLRYVAFIPAIDAILYAPKLAFADAYFGGVEEEDPFRDDPRRMANQLPRGKRIYEKLKDLIGSRRLLLALGLLCRGEAGLRVAAAHAAGEDLGWFFIQWLGRYPRVNYRLGKVVSEKRSGGGVRVTIEVLKQGEVVEPVEVRLRDRRGHSLDLVWDGRGQGALLAADLLAALDSVELDPRRRLVQWIPSRSDDPRFGDRRPARVKFLYNNFGAVFDLSNLTAALAIDFSLKRVYDLRNAVRVIAFHSESALAGLQIGYARGFGPEVDPNRLPGSASLSVAVARLNGDFARQAGEPETDGTRITFATGVTYDNRAFFHEPWHAVGATARVGYTLTALDRGATLGSFTGKLLLRRLGTLAPDHFLGGELGFDAVAGDIRMRSQLLASGGDGGIRGYQPDELFSRARLISRLEYLHPIVRGLDWNLLHLFHLRSIGGIVFADLATLSDCDDYSGMMRASSFYAGVGYGLRFRFDYLGISPGVMNFEVAVPLLRRSRSCMEPPGVPPPSPQGRPKLAFYLSFQPDL